MYTEQDPEGVQAALGNLIQAAQNEAPWHSPQAREKAQATRRARTAEKQQRKAAEVQARREAREARKNEREKAARLKREKREAAQAARLERLNSDVPRVQPDPELIPNWSELRLSRVTVRENGQFRRVSLAELADLASEGREI